MENKMKEMIVIFEINGLRRGYRGNMYCCERFFKAIHGQKAFFKFITAYEVR